MISTLKSFVIFAAPQADWGSNHGANSQSQFKRFAFELRNIVCRQPLPGYLLAIQDEIGGGCLLTFKPIATDLAKTAIGRCQLPTTAVDKL
jgi:plasmid replication initiation protein